jgi:hypothetical protein
MKKTCLLYFKLQFQHNAMIGLKAILPQNRVLLAIFIKPEYGRETNLGLT